MQVTPTRDAASDLSAYCLDLGRRARAAARALATAPTERKDRWLRLSADALQAQLPVLLAANERDLAGAQAEGLTSAQIDRLRLTPARVQSAADGLREVAGLPDPVGQVRERRTRPSGLQIHKVGVPLGVILFIYESRPNV